MSMRLGVILLVALLAGCLGGTAPPPLVRHYSLEYPPPRVGNVSTEALLKVGRFSVDRLYMGTSMLFSKGSFRRDAYHEQRWRVSPGDMVTDFLKRDLRHAGLFRAVLSARDAEETRFLLEGGVEEFLEVDDGKSRKALLVAVVALLDLSSRDVSRRVVFQRTYRCETLFSQEGPEGLAEAMSRAMSQLSTRVIADIDSALQRGGHLSAAQHLTHLGGHVLYREWFQNEFRFPFALFPLPEAGRPPVTAHLENQLGSCIHQLTRRFLDCFTQQVDQVKVRAVVPDHETHLPGERGGAEGNAVQLR